MIEGRIEEGIKGMDEIRRGGRIEIRKGRREKGRKLGRKGERQEGKEDGRKDEKSQGVRNEGDILVSLYLCIFCFVLNAPKDQL